MTIINDTIKEGYRYSVALNLQQKGSRLADCVRLETQSTERHFYDQIGPSEAKDIATRHADTPIVNGTFDRRMVSLITSDWGDLIDTEEKLDFLIDPTSAYALNAAYALGRKKDIRIIEAALGTAWIGKRGETAVNFLSSNTIAASYSDDVAATPAVETGLTVQKLLKAREMLDDADVDDDEEQFCIVTAKQISDLLRTTEVTSEDYAAVKSLVSGKIDKFMGFTFKKVSSLILPKKVNKRSVICFAKSGLLLAMNNDIKTDVSYRADKRMATQVYASLSCGASRMNEQKVVEILCKE